MDEQRFTYRHAKHMALPYVFEVKSLGKGPWPRPGVSRLVIRWCMDEIGEELLGESGRWNVGTESIRFRDHDAAMLFRLRWC